ncbi:bifunctional 5,10-methylene-tetrahydrofolate dehydrogenase/5,10-methylene-tetrahydrofolate cyclohydrolase [Mycoplasma sp. (ex Biomphalaria glabrata)]|uniref:Uncharacterized protein n=1 Tax=Biomphalaria glabrata TaxID=6526 RepID=A0A182ZBY7_BIOGL|nr:bifunctional 5,10-methylenetetrahydrofolate dehydrogenase/5,10-methenyltetrahydrofolate cyclohydrolase [Mycoplasma sp. (ex Biomphalaria glabrata)]ALV23252.1 bifunctional 5,10-methylene-tetrahydrofolate dehydrogenase/5,10-methylene-tetrahydrofolate cyclohydrolase [Mycoplasma sp. (ex Biomphalaria glabrata)]
MAAKILDGSSLAKKIKDQIKQEIITLIEKGFSKPKLVVLMVGNNYSSQKYVTHKIKACEYCGIDSEIIRLDENITEEELDIKIDELNNNPSIHGILVQFPLPKPIRKRDIMLKISYQKDVDGFNPLNMGRLAQDNADVQACTPFGIMKLLDEYNISCEGKHAVIIGRSQIVGRPMALMLLNEKAVITITHRYISDLKYFTKLGDIVISATGRPKSITADMIKDGAICIDVGISQNEKGKLSGDFDFDEVSKKASWITPVPGGVGPMTVAMLMYNQLQVYKKYAIKIID